MATKTSLSSASAFTNKAKVRQRNKLSERLAIWSFQSVLFASVVGEFLGTTQIFSMSFYTFHIVDLPFVLMLFAIIPEIGRELRRPNAVLICSLAIAAIIFMNFALGLSQQTGPALLAIRANGLLATSLLLAACMRPTPPVLIAIRQALYVSMVALGVLIVLRTAIGPSLFMSVAVDASDVNDGGRSLSSNGAMLLVFAEAFIASRAVRGGAFRFRSANLLAIGVAILIFLTGQGTATICCIVVIATILVFEPGPSRQERFVLAALLGMTALIVILVNGHQLMSQANLLHRIDNMGTRRMVWEALMASWHNYPLQMQLFGLAFGHDLNLYIFRSGTGYHWLHSVHSMYYGALPLMGYVGLAFYIALIATLLIWTVPGRRGVMPAYPFACCLAVIVLSFSYEVRQASLIGLVVPIWWTRALPMMTRHRRRTRGELAEVSARS